MLNHDRRLFTAHQAKAIDIETRKKFGISTLVLMENAGYAAAEEALKVLKEKNKVAVFCGKGNNGGDGFVAARHLLAHGFAPDIFLAGKITEAENEAEINLEILLKLKAKIFEVDEEFLAVIEKKIGDYSLIIDALLGVGLTADVRGICRDLIAVINTSKAYILSVDIPSGLDATTGEILGCCVKATETVTFVAKKRGMVLGEGPRYCGRVVVKDLGIPL